MNDTKKIKKTSFVILECENCRLGIESRPYVSQYTTKKNQQNTISKLTFQKYCKYCKKHQTHIETK